jgi:hypothetical protein
MSNLEWGLLITLIISLLGNIVTIIGWVYNHNKREELEKELVKIKRKHEVKDREVEAFRKLGEGFVTEITKALKELGGIYFFIKAEADRGNKNLGRYNELILHKEEPHSKLETLKLSPDYERFMRYLPKGDLGEFFHEITKSIAGCAEEIRNLHHHENLQQISHEAFDVGIKSYALAKGISMVYSQIEQELIEE